jgi:hypothetical protein
MGTPTRSRLTPLVLKRFFASSTAAEKDGDPFPSVIRTIFFPREEGREET